MRITKKQDRMPGIILTILLFVAEIAFTVLLLYTNLLSAKYIGIVFAVLLVLLLIDHLLIRKFRKQIRFWIGIILMVIILAVLGIASFYIYKTVSALDDITGVNKEITEINVYVKQGPEPYGCSQLFIWYSGRSRSRKHRHCITTDGK